jgi:hypothetical protein
LLYRLKSLQAQEEARHRNSEPRRTDQYRSQKQSSSKQHASELRAEQRSSDQRSSDYEKNLQNLKDEIAILSAEKSGHQGRSDKISQIILFRFFFLS